MPMQALRLVLVEAGRADDLFDVGRIGAGEASGIRVAGEQLRRHHVDPEHRWSAPTGSSRPAARTRWVVELAERLGILLGQPPRHLVVRPFGVRGLPMSSTLFTASRQPQEPRRRPGISLDGHVANRDQARARRRRARSDRCAARRRRRSRRLSAAVGSPVARPRTIAATRVSLLCWRSTRPDRLVGYAQLARANDSTVVELVVAPSERARVRRHWRRDCC